MCPFPYWLPAVVPPPSTSYPFLALALTHGLVTGVLVGVIIGWILLEILIFFKPWILIAIMEDDSELVGLLDMLLVFAILIFSACAAWDVGRLGVWCVYPELWVSM